MQNVNDINKIKAMNCPAKISLTKHARQRLLERDIRISDIVEGIKNGEIIKEYEDDKPLPSCLLLGKSTEKRPIHILISFDNEFIYLITAYYPAPDLWEADLKTRKRC